MTRPPSHSECTCLLAVLLLSAGSLSAQAPSGRLSDFAVQPLPAPAIHLSNVGFTVEEPSLFLEFVGGGALVGAFAGLALCTPIFKDPPNNGSEPDEEEKDAPGICRGGAVDAVVVGGLIGAALGYFVRLGFAAAWQRASFSPGVDLPTELVTFRVPIGPRQVTPACRSSSRCSFSSCWCSPLRC